MKKNAARQERKRQSRKKTLDNSGKHAFLRILRCHRDYLFAIGDGRFGHAFEFDICLIELNRAYRSREFNCVEAPVNQ